MACNFGVIILLAFIAPSSGKEPAGSRMATTQDFNDILVGNLLELAFNMPAAHFHSARLDDITLGKSVDVVAPTSVIPGPFSPRVQFGPLRDVKTQSLPTQHEAPYRWSRSDSSAFATPDMRVRQWSLASAARGSEASATSSSMENALTEGDVVVVVGAGGNVGRLVALRLADAGKYKVRATSCDPSKLKEFLADKKVEFFAANTREPATLKDALTGANCVIMCTGVTAFKTKAWDNGNTPDAVDNLGVKNVVDTWVSSNAKDSLKRFVLMSSIGVTRRDKFPYVVLNLGGVLDAKQKGEDAVTTAAAQHSFDYSIVRPGQLTGGPYTNNRYLGTLFQIDKSDKQKVVLERGDRIVGDSVRSTLAEIIAQSIESPGTANLDFVVVNERGTAPSEAGLQEMFAQLPTASGKGDVQMPRPELLGETIQQALGNLVSGKLFKGQD